MMAHRTFDSRVTFYGAGRPSWQRTGEGRWSLEALVSPAVVDVLWVPLFAAELGEKSSRQTIITLDDADTRALYELLRNRIAQLDTLRMTREGSL